MDIKFLIKGLILGFSIAAPIGPIGVICIKRTLSNGRWAGLVSGLGVATADALYGTVAGFGLTFISAFLLSQETLIRLLGGLFLCYLGVRTLYSKPPIEAAETKRKGIGLVGDYLSVLFLTLTNPMTIISFVAVFAGLGIVGAERSYLSASLLVVGVFVGSTVWWLILSSLVDWLRGRFNQQRLLWVNRVSGVIIIGFALVLLLSQKK